MSVLLLTPDNAFEQRVRDALGPATDIVRVEARIWHDDPRYAVPLILSDASAADVVIIGPEIEVQYAIDYAYEFDLQHPDISVILCAPSSADVLSEALHAGVRDVIDPLAANDRILDACKRAAEAAARTRSQLTHESSQAAASDGQVITVASPKGGSGKTTVATNLAIGLAQSAPGQVAIVDLDLQFGDVATALQLMPEHSIADAARSVAQLDTMSLKVLLSHHPVDLYALCAPDSPAAGERVNSTQIVEILNLLKREFRYVVIDTTAGLGEHTLAALEAATDIVMICAMDVPGVRSFRTTLFTLDEIGLTSATRHVVLTRADARVGLAIEDIERTIGRAIDVTIPSTRAIPLSINQGTPILQSDQRRTAVHQSLTALTSRFTSAHGKPSEARRWLRKRT